jgi:hypothetical protein
VIVVVPIGAGGGVMEMLVSDVVFAIDDARIHAHRLILSLRSPVFKVNVPLIQHIRDQFTSLYSLRRVGIFFLIIRLLRMQAMFNVGMMESSGGEVVVEGIRAPIFSLLLRCSTLLLTLGFSLIVSHLAILDYLLF